MSLKWDTSSEFQNFIKWVVGTQLKISLILWESKGLLEKVPQSEALELTVFLGNINKIWQIVTSQWYDCRKKHQLPLTFTAISLLLTEPELLSHFFVLQQLSENRWVKTLCGLKVQPTQESRVKFPPLSFPEKNKRIMHFLDKRVFIC